MKRILLSLLILLQVSDALASHMMGGEITWRCSGNNYIFYLKVYRDCRGTGMFPIPPGGQVLDVSGHPSLSTIAVNFVSVTDISPPGCNIDCNTNIVQGAVEEYIYRSNPINLGPATPGAAGWTFSWTLCCRNNTIDNLPTPGSLSMTLRSKMFSYNGAPATPCFDNSPAFAERPSTFICTGYPFTYNHTAIDIESDSLRYVWAQPADGTPNALINFSGGFTTNNQLPGNPTLNANTGEVSIFPNVSGDYATCIKVEAWKCNVKVAEIYRDIQIGLANNCLPLFNGAQNIAPEFLQTDAVTPFTSYIDTLTAGDSVDITLMVQDLNFSAPGVLQITTVEVVSSALDSQYFAPPGTGCLFPPCAEIISPPPPPPYVLPPGGGTMSLKWATSCAHLPRTDGCVNLSNVYTFVIKAKDNYCPTPAQNNVTVTYVIQEPPRLDPPILKCASVDTSGSVTLTWEEPWPEDTFNTFYNYQIMRSTSPTGPWTTIDSVMGYYTNTYTDNSINAQQQSYYYTMATRCGCDSLKLSEDSSDVLQTIKLDADFTAGSSAQLTWNPLKTPLPLTTLNGYYYIYRTNEATGVTTFVDSTNLNSYTDNSLTGCIDSITWKVGIADISGCISWSSFDGDTYANDTLTEPPTPTCISVLGNGNVELDWIIPAPADTGLLFGGYTIYRSDAGGPFNLIGSVPAYLQSSFTDVTANAYSGGPYQYHIKTLDNCGSIESDPSIAIQPIIVNTDTTGGNGNVIVTWNNPYVIPQNTNYEIWRKVNSVGTYAQVGSTSGATATFSFNDPITFCKDSLVYYVRHVNPLPDSCTSMSTIEGDSVIQSQPQIDPPVIRCVSVEPGGVNVTWDKPVNFGGYFDEYLIYRSTAIGGPYVLVTTINNYNTTTYFDAAGNANAQVNYYYMQTRAGCDAGSLFLSDDSEKIETMFLSVTPVTGFAQLAWNAPHDPMPAGSEGFFKVFRSPTGLNTWVQRGTVNVVTGNVSYSYNDSIDQCNIDYEYKIEIDNGSPLYCTAKSSVADSTFSYIGNVIDAPELHCVSVLPSGQIELTWNYDTPPVSFVNFSKYVIFGDDGTGVFDTLTTIGNLATTSYIDVTANGNTQPYSYYLHVNSGCSGTEPSPTNSSLLTSIHLSTTDNAPTADPGQALLTWNELSNPFPTSATQYNAFSDYGWTGSTPPGTLTATHDVVHCDTVITHYIEVNDALGCVSKSNVVTNTFTYLGNIVEAPDLRCVSVLPSGDIELTWDLSPISSFAEFNSYEIYKDGSFLTAINNSAQTSHIDAGAGGNAGTHSYYLLSKSGCDGTQPSATNSATLNSLFLTTTDNAPLSDPGQALLTWNDLSVPFPSTATQYNAYSDYGWTGTTAPGTVTTTHDVLHCDTVIAHYVEVNDASGCTSKSNVATNTFTYLGNIVEAPDLRCVSVLPSGDIELTWDLSPISSFGEFNSYEIYKDGSFLTAITNSGQTNHIDAGAGGNAGSHSYYLLSKSGCSGTQPSLTNSATLNSLFLTTTDNAPLANPGEALLSWNELSNPFPVTATQYNAYSDYGWTGTTLPGTHTVSHDVLHCDTVITHYIEVNDASGCVSKSNVVTKSFTYLGNVVEAPDLRCIDVQQPAGQIEITWSTTNILDFTHFSHYDIYRDGVSIGTINNQAALNFVDAGATGNSVSHNYYIRISSGCSGSVLGPQSATMSSMLLTVVNSADTVANLSWNPVDVNNTNNFIVHRQYQGVWTTYPVNGTTFTQVNNICEDTVNYYISQLDVTGCESKSSFESEIFKDIVNNDQIVIKSASVNPINDTEVTIKWQPTALSDIAYYKIWRKNPFIGWDSIGTVNIGVHSFIDATGNPDGTSESYVVISEDICQNKSLVGFNPHNTLHTASAMDICRRAIDVRLDIPPYKYMNMPGDISHYEVYRSEDGGASYNPVATIGANATIYSDTNLINKTIYCYYLKAIGNDIAIDPELEANSNSSCDTAELLTLPQFSYLNKASVIANRRVNVEVMVDTADSPDVSRFKFQRSLNKTGPFYTVGTVGYNGTPYYSFVDNTAETDENSYYYRVVTVDSCGNEVLTSNLGRTILLTGMPHFNLTNRMSWNDYEEWLGEVKGYEIFRSVDGVWDNAPVGSYAFGLGMNEHIDNVTELWETTGRYCYVAVAYEDTGNVYGFADSSFSNEFCLIQEPHLFVPNAFTPDGKNPVFKPEFIYTDAKNYKFIVFNRWGEKVFETENPSLGWDGTIEGDKAPQGTYVYNVRLFGTNGQELNKSGRVSLLR